MTKGYSTHMYGLATRGGNEVARNTESGIMGRQVQATQNFMANPGSGYVWDGASGTWAPRVQKPPSRPHYRGGGYSYGGGASGSGSGGTGGNGGNGNYATSIPIPFGDQAIKESQNAAHAQAVQAAQNPSSPLAQKLNALSQRFGANSGLAQGAGLQGIIATDALGREAARNAGDQMAIQNQQYGYIPRSQEGLGLAGLAMQQDQAAANRAASMQSGLLSGLLSLLR